MSSVLSQGGPVVYLIFLAAAIAIAAFFNRVLHYHRAQINTAEFLSGVKNVLKRDNLVEAISICDATPGPVPRLVKAALLNRDRGRDGMREAIEESGIQEIPVLEAKLNILATVAQIAPLLGLLGTILGFMKVFGAMQKEGPFAHMSGMAGGVWEALICSALGLLVAIPAHVAYNYLVTRLGVIVRDMEKCSSEIVTIVSEGMNGKAS